MYTTLDGRWGDQRQYFAFANKNKKITILKRIVNKKLYWLTTKSTQQSI